MLSLSGCKNNQTPMDETLITESEKEKIETLDSKSAEEAADVTIGTAQQEEDVESLLWSYYKKYALYGDENSEILGIQTNLIGDVSLSMADGCYKELSESLAEENETNRVNGNPVDGVRKVSVHRADQKILSFLKVSYDDYGEISYISRTYDTASGRELKLVDLVKDMDTFRGLVAEQLQENELQEEELEVWTAGYEGLTIYLQTEKSKAIPVMISYKEHPKLFKEDMRQELSGFMVGFDPYSDLIFDVDEDGKSDLIRMELRENSEIVVQVGHQSVVCQQKAYEDGDGCFVGGYFVKNNDGKKYILIYTNTDWDYSNSYSVIRLEEAGPVYVGDGIFNFDMAHALTDPAKIMDETESRIQTGGIAYDTCWAHVNGEGYLEPVEEIYYCGEIYAVSEPIKGKQVDVDGTAQDNTIEIPEGEMVLLFRTDYQDYKDYILVDGRICRVSLTESEAASFGVEEKGDSSRQENNSHTDIPWVNAYVELLNGSDYEHGNYALAYVDEDDIPELIRDYNYRYQISTCFAGEPVLCYEEMGYGTHSTMYYFLPEQNNIVSTFTGDGGVGAFEEYLTLENGELKYEMSIGKIPQFDNQGNLLYDESGNYVYSYVKEYEGIEEEITEEMWKSMTMANEDYVYFDEIEYFTKEEMLEKLLNYRL